MGPCNAEVLSFGRLWVDKVVYFVVGVILGWHASALAIRSQQQLSILVVCLANDFERLDQQGNGLLLS